MPSPNSISHDSVVLFIDPGRQLTAAFPARAGQAWRPLVSGSIEDGLQQLNGHRLQAVVVNLAVPGVNLSAMVKKVRQRAGAAPIVAVPSGAEEVAIPAALDVSVLHHPVDWGTVRALIEAPHGGAARPASPATPFLRDEACRLERGNRFEASGDDGAPIHGKVLRLSRHFVVTETSDPSRMVSPGWCAPEVRIILDGVVSYAGPARM